MRCSVCSFPTCFDPKLSTTRVNLMGLHLGVQNPVTVLIWLYSCFASSFSSSSFTMSPSWGRTYMSFRVSTYTLPSIFPSCVGCTF